MARFSLQQLALRRSEFLTGLSTMPIGASTTLRGITHELGAPRRDYGERSEFERSKRLVLPSAYGGNGSARTPLQDLYGIITPSALHFERLHGGVPTLDPRTHALMIDGLVERPIIFTLEDLQRLPSVSRIHFIECAGNSSREHEGLAGDTPQRSHGLLSCSEWTGVPLSELLDRVGVKPTAKWIYAEGADAGRLARSIPLDKALDDVLVAYGQNGEALRPEQGYPLRLLVPGWEGNVNVKWLRTLQVLESPAMTRDEAASYTDFLPGGVARNFSFVMEAKSVITRPAGGQTLTHTGLHQITGFAWSGRGRITSVEVTADGARTWENARIPGDIHDKALTRFTLPWHWDGTPSALASRCTDETGYVQPTREQLIAARGTIAGPDGFEHYNGIKWWQVHESGHVTHA